MSPGQTLRYVVTLDGTVIRDPVQFRTIARIKRRDGSRATVELPVRYLKLLYPELPTDNNFEGTYLIPARAEGLYNIEVTASGKLPSGKPFKESTVFDFLIQ